MNVILLVIMPATMVQPAQVKALRDGKSMSDALATKPSGWCLQLVKQRRQHLSINTIDYTSRLHLPLLLQQRLPLQQLSPADA